MSPYGGGGTPSMDRYRGPVSWSPTEHDFVASRGRRAYALRTADHPDGWVPSAAERATRPRKARPKNGPVTSNVRRQDPDTVRELARLAAIAEREAMEDRDAIAREKIRATLAAHPVGNID